MNKTKKALVMMLCAVLLVAASVMGTVAYLTSTDAVTNTFTVGNVKITMDETKVDVYGVKDNNATDRVKTNDYKLIPGHSYVKDPQIHVAAGSEDCWLFVKLENGISAIETETATSTMAGQMTADGKWTLVTEETNVYAYKEKVSAGSNIDTFSTFAIKSDVSNDALKAYVTAYKEGTTSGVENIVENAMIIKVTAYAVQKDSFETAQAAWEATFGA